MLADVFDFDLARAEHGEPVRLASGGELQAVAGDAAGGTFFVCDDGPVLYADSEGGAGVLAADLTEAVQLVVGLPTWHDVVGFAPDLDVMRRQFEESYAELKRDHEPAIEEHQAEVSAALGLEWLPAEELLTRLRTSLTDLSPGYALLNEEGDEYEAL